MMSRDAKNPIHRLLYITRDTAARVRARLLRVWTNKKILAPSLGVLCLVAAMWGMSAQINFVRAATVGSGMGANIVADTAVAYGILYVGAYALMQFLSWGLTIVASFLDYAFLVNSYINPGQLAIVQTGWTYMRDLANGVFILLLLWIAITIVFNLEGMNGKRLLVRVIMVALLINFSLVLVSMVFALGNVLAQPFAKAMGSEICTEQAGVGGQTTIKCSPPNTIASLIMYNSHVHEISRVFTEAGALETFKQANEAFSKPVTVQSENKFTSIAQYLGAPQTAHAGAGAAIGGASICLSIIAGGAIATGSGIGSVVGVPALLTGILCSALANYAIPIATGLLVHATGMDVWLLEKILNAIVPSVFLFLTLMAMLTAAVILFLRLVAMVFLGVSAPIAFLGFAFPKFGQQFWSKWISQLFRWAAVTPIFYFLLYLALLMLQAGNKNISVTSASNIPPIANLYRIMNLVLFLVFLWAAVYATKKTAGHFAETALSLGRKGLGFGLGVATGFVARRALPKLGAMAEKGGQAIGKVENPLFRGLLRTPASILQRTAAASRKQVADAQGRFGSMTSAEIQRLIGSGTLGEADLAAGMQVLQNKKDLAPIEGIRGYDTTQQDKGANTLRRLGLDINGLLRANPLLAKERDYSPKAIAEELKLAQQAYPGKTFTNDELAQRIAWRKVRDMASLDLGLIKTDTPDSATAQAFFEFAQPSQLSELARINPAKKRELSEWLLKKNNAAQQQEIVNRMDPATVRYFGNNVAQELGWSLPPGVTHPSASPTPGSVITIPSNNGSVSLGSPYPTPMSATGGSGAYTWRISSGSLPPGLTLDPSGRFIGTASGPRGTTYIFKVEADDGAGNTESTLVNIRVT